MDLKESSVDDEPLNEADSERRNSNDASPETAPVDDSANESSSIAGELIDQNSCELVTLGDDLEMKLKIKEDQLENNVNSAASATVTDKQGAAVKSATPDDASSKKKSSKSKTTTTAPPAAHSLDDPIDLQLPHSFHLKYLGKRDAAGIWGFKYTRKPVDSMVAAARLRSPIQPLPYLELIVSVDGIHINEVLDTSSANSKSRKTDTKDSKSLEFPQGLVPIHTISYGVQDLVYTRVFAMIVVSETNNVREKHPFQCHAFVSDSRQTARRLTYALAEAFKLFSKTVKAEELRKTQKRFAIDLRQPEDIKTDEVVDDSEA